MKCKLQNMNVSNKTVIVRVDYNVPVKDNEILDDNKIKASLETINYLINNNCKIILLSHFGKIKSEEDKKNNSLEIVAKRLNELVSSSVIFSRETRSPELVIRVKKLNPKEILVVENTRFEDYPNKLESNCDLELASYWAELADIFVLDAFASAHRNHASTSGISKFIPSCLGFLVQKEMDMLDKYVLNAKGSFGIIMGGAKIDDKLMLMQSLLPTCNYMMLTGGLANTCLKTLGLNIGESVASEDEEILEQVKEMLVKYRNKIVLPLDCIVGRKYDENYVSQKNINMVLNDEFIGDIGTKTIEKYQSIINMCNNIFVNGTAGIYEDKRFSNGTMELLDVLSKSGKNLIAGGGDSVSAINKFNYSNMFTYLSTGGGATLEYLINKSLPAIDTVSEEIDVL